MKMRITDSVDVAGAGMQQPDKNKEKGSGRQTGEIMPQDKVSVSGQGKEIGRLQAEVSKLPDIRPDRVNDVKNAINTNTYNVRGESVAGKMLKEAVIDSII